MLLGNTASRMYVIISKEHEYKKRPHAGVFFIAYRLFSNFNAH